MLNQNVSCLLCEIYEEQFEHDVLKNKVIFKKKQSDSWKKIIWPEKLINCY